MFPDGLGQMEPPSPDVTVPLGYIEHAPPPDLASVVSCVWTRRLPTASDVGVHRVIPDGSADILFAFGGSEGSGPADLLHTHIVGPMTRPLVVDGIQPRLHIGVRLAPGFASLLMSIPMSEIVDVRVEYDSLDPDATRETEVVGEAASDEDRVRRIFDLVRRRLGGRRRISRSLLAAIRRIAAARGNVRVTALAQELGVTRQYLARQFSSHVGLSPKAFACIVRTQAVLARADAARSAYPRNSGPPNWSAIAQELGYCDQPHMIDEFKELTGVTPGYWLTAR